MSVRNILDGTIPVDGGLTPDSEISVKHVYADRGFMTPGDVNVGGNISVVKEIAVRAIKTSSLSFPSASEEGSYPTVLTYDNITTPSITATGTIHADNEITAPGVGATLFSGGSFKGSNVDAGFITAENWIKTPALQVNGTQVLTPIKVEEKQSIAVTYSDGSTGTISNSVISETTNLNSQQHVLTCQTSLGSLSKPIKQLIIPTGLDFTGKNAKALYATVAVIDGSDLLLGMVYIYVESNQLMVKVVFTDTPSYSSINIRINMNYYSSF